MSSSSFPSVFDSEPLSPQFPYHDPVQYAKNETSEFLDYLDPFTSPEKSLDAFRLRQTLESGAIRIDETNATTSLSASLAFLTPDLLSSPNTSSFSSDGKAEIDDAFINQISCFSELSNCNVGASSAVSSSSPNLSQSSTSSSSSSPSSKSTVNPASLISHAATQLDMSTCYPNKIFARSLPWVLSTQSVDSETWVECSDPVPVTLGGRTVHISGWEPPVSDSYPLVQIDFKDWAPSAPMFLAIERGLAKKSVKSERSKPKRLSGSRPRRAETSKSWGRRLASNRPAFDKGKRRRVETILPLESQPVEEQRGTPVNFQSQRDDNDPITPGCDDTVTSTEEDFQVPDASTGKNEDTPRFDVPGYVYPHPDVAKAITQRAAEDERERGLAASARWTEQLQLENECDEVEKVADEFPAIPGGLVTGNDGPTRSSLVNAFDLSRLPSPSPGSSIRVRQALRPTRSLLDYSSSTRRRALVRFRSDVLPRGSVPLVRKIGDDESAISGGYNEEGSVVSLPSKCLAEDGSQAMQRSAIRARAP